MISLHSFLLFVSVGDLSYLKVSQSTSLFFSTTEGIGVHGHRGEISVRVLALSLAGGGAVIVPDGKFLGLLGLKLDGLGLGPEVLSGAVNPDVHTLSDVVWLLQGQVPVQDSLVGRAIKIHSGGRREERGGWMFP